MQTDYCPGILLNPIIDVLSNPSVNQENLNPILYPVLERLASEGNDDMLNRSALGVIEHIQNCRGPLGCLDRYMLRVEMVARKLMQLRKLSEEDLPGLVREADSQMLGLSVGI